ncbi:unnamed protein product, partial [Trichobilharzia regenti]
MWIQSWHENAYHCNNQPSVERLYYTQPYEYNSSIYPNAIQQNDLEMNTIYPQTINSDNKNNSPIDTKVPVPFLHIPDTSNTISNINSDTNSMNPSNFILSSTILPNHCTTSNSSTKSIISNKTMSAAHFHDIPTGNNGNNSNQNEVVKSEGSTHDSFLNSRQSTQWDILMNNGITTSTTAIPIPTAAARTLTMTTTTATTTADDVTTSSYNDNDNSSNEYKCNMDNKHFYQRYIDDDNNKSINMNNHYFNQCDVFTEKNNS